jgi:hypothetical protein
MSNGISIAGRKVFDGPDFYRTPEWATEALLEKEKFPGVTWECACGDGSISKVLKKHGLVVVSSDLYDRGYGMQDDFLVRADGIEPGTKIADNVITNPPFNLAQQFVDRALEVSERKVAMLLKLQFLEGAKRKEWFKTTPLRTVYVFSKRLTMYPADGEPPKNSGTTCFAWYLWEHGYKSKPMIEWI